MDTKLFEVRDRGTFIPVIATLMIPVGTEADAEAFLLKRAGFDFDSAFVLLARLEGGDALYDPFGWVNRTMRTAHIYIQDNWDALRSGDVVDVEFILGERPAPKISERGR